MDKSLQSIRFLIALFVAMVGVFGGYGFWFQHRIVHKNTIIPLSYKQLLIEEIKGPRIVFDSGSSAYHAIDPQLVESVLGYPCILLSDHAGASLQDKIRRLERYSQPGDIVIFPLEWNYYHAPDLNENHLRSLFDQGRGYYFSMSEFEQWYRAFQTPLKLVTAELIGETEDISTSYRDELLRLDTFEQHFFRNVPNGEAGPDKGIVRLNKDSFCDGYIIPEFAWGPIPFHTDFEKSIHMMGSLAKRKQLTIILIPPIVCGADCYEHYGLSLEHMIRATERICDTVGIYHILDFRRYDMEVKYLLDTHFHITEDGRDDITAKIINDLTENGLVSPNSNPEPKVIEQLPSIFENRKMELMRAKMPLWNGDPTPLIDGVEALTFEFDANWYDLEPWGRWASAESATIYFRPDPKRVYKGLYLNALYFNGSQVTRIYINDVLVGVSDFSENHQIWFEHDLKFYQQGDPLVKVRFESSDLVSPKILGTGEDSRVIKFGLNSMQLLTQ